LLKPWLVFLPSNQHIYILNNASEGNGWALLQEKYSSNTNISFYHSEINIGPAGGRNVLLHHAKEEWIFVVDNDITIEPEKNWKQIFDEQQAQFPEIKIFCPRVYNVHEKNYSAAHQFTNKDGVVHMIDSDAELTNYFSCCAVIIHSSIFETYGPFDADLFAFEDYEFSIRAMLSANGNLQVQTLKQITAVHDHQVQKSKADKKAVLERYDAEKIQKSMEHIVAKHHIAFAHEWQWWTKKQLFDMNGQSFLEKLKRKLLSLVKG
jgi:GT2 family glycosyltransferase